MMVHADQALAVLRERAGVEGGGKQVERHAEALGRDIARDEAEVVEPEPPAAPTMYVGLDGTGVPVRRGETAGRVGRQADGSAKTREAKLVVVWSAEERDAQGVPRRDEDSVTCSAAIESIAARDTDRAPAPFAERVLRELERRGFRRAGRRVALGDGAAWIWNFADEHLPGAIRIVDLFHAKEHVFDAAKAIYGDGSDLAAQWGKARRDELDAVGAGPVVDALRQHADACDRARASPTASGCATRRSAPRACPSPPASSKAPASPSWATASSAAACTGPSKAPTPSSPCDAPSRATASTTTGNGRHRIHDIRPQI